MGVRTNPAVFVLGGSGGGEEEGTGVGGSEERGRQEVGVFPLLSWYHASWDDEPDLPPGVNHIVLQEYKSAARSSAPSANTLLFQENGQHVQNVARLR